MPPSDAAFQHYRIIRRRAESEVITSYWLAPADGSAPPPFCPGQYLTLRLPGGEKPNRTYTVSSAPTERGSYRITVKREPSPPDRPDLPPGRGSGWLATHGEVGAELEVLGPRGAFVLDETSARPVLLLSGGVGLTPMVSMLHALAPTGRATHFIHACDHGGVHALRDEVLEAAARHPTVRPHFIYRVPRASDRANSLFHSEGILTRALLQRLLPLDDYDAYLCGPPGFMAAVYGMLRGLGVAAERIRYEFFGPATVLETTRTEPEVPSAPPPPEAGAAAPIQVVLARSGLAGVWDGASATLLDFAEALGARPDFSCRAGICNTCECSLLAGEVTLTAEPLDPPAAGRVLPCIARPTTSVTLDL